MMPTDPMEAFVRTFDEFGFMATLPQEARVAVVQTLLNGSVSIALRYQTPDEVRAALRAILETIS